MSFTYYSTDATNRKSCEGSSPTQWMASSWLVITYSLVLPLQGIWFFQIICASNRPSNSNRNRASNGKYYSGIQNNYNDEEDEEDEEDTHQTNKKDSSYLIPNIKNLYRKRNFLEAENNSNSRKRYSLSDEYYVSSAVDGRKASTSEA